MLRTFLLLGLAACASQPANSSTNGAQAAPQADPGATAEAPTAAPAPDPAIAAGGEYTALLYSDRHDLLRHKFTTAMSDAMSGSELFGLRQQLVNDYGGETAVVSETVEPYQGNKMYKRRAHFARTEQVLEIQWVLDDEGRVLGLFVEAVASDQP